MKNSIFTYTLKCVSTYLFPGELFSRIRFFLERNLKPIGLVESQCSNLDSHNLKKIYFRDIALKLSFLLFALFTGISLQAQVAPGDGGCAPAFTGNVASGGDLPGPVQNITVMNAPIDGSTPPFTQSMNCPPNSPTDFHNNRGFVVGCGQPQCEPLVSQSVPAVFPQPDPVAPGPDITVCPTIANTYQNIENNSMNVTYLQYWNSCNGNTLLTVSAPNQGFINQYFCDLDTFGLPAAPASAGAPLAGQVSGVPVNQNTIDGFAQDIDPTSTCPNGGDAELIQADFWIVIPSHLTDIGFQINGPAADAGAFYAGPDLNNMCGVADLMAPTALITDQVGVMTSYYDYSDIAPSPDCGKVVLRVRFYTTDIGAVSYTHLTLPTTPYV